MKKVFVSAIALAVAFLVMATFIFAWFAMSTTPRAGDFIVKATSLDGIEIALDIRASSGNFDDTLGNLNNFTRLSYRPYISSEQINSYFNSLYGEDVMLVPAQARSNNGYGLGKTFYNRDGEDATLNLAPSERAFAEFTLYFRAETQMLASERSVLLDMTDYSSAGQPADYKSYAVGDPCNSFFLPIDWIGSSFELASQKVNVDEYVIIDKNNRILGINMFKYHDCENLDEIFIDPRTGNFCTFIPSAAFSAPLDGFSGQSIWTDISAGTILDDACIMQPINERLNLVSYGLGEYMNKYYCETASGISLLDGVGTQPVSVYGATADALRVSFTKIDNTSGNLEDFNRRVDESPESDAVIWNPNHGCGRFPSDSLTNNFALHMLLATDGYDLDLIDDIDSYLAAHKYESDDLNAISLVPLCKLDAQNGISYDGYAYAAVTFRIWIEGWDAECFNSILSSVASISLQFKLSDV